MARAAGPWRRIGADGSVAVTGFHYGITDFDPSAGVSTRSSAGGADVFIAKYDSAGNFLWATDFGGSSNEYPMDIAIDEFGDIFVCGSFNGTVDFNPGFGSATHTSRGGTDAFLVKFDANGTFQWVITFGGGSSTNALDGADGIVMDPIGDYLYLVGSFEGSFIDVNPLGTAVYQHSTGDQNMFLIKYNSNTGQHIWSQNMGSGTLDDYARDVAVDIQSNVYISGFFSGSCDFAPGVSGGVLTSAGGKDGFIASYTSNGTYRWAQRMGGVNDDDAWGVTASPAGEIGVCGKYMIAANIGGNNLTSNGSEDMFIARLNSSGAFQWVHSLGGPHNDHATGIAADGCGNFFLTGYFQGTVDFDPGTGTHNLSAPVSVFNPPFSIVDRYGYFLARYNNSTGALAWVGAGNANSGTSRPWDIHLDRCEDVYLTGEFTSSQDFNITGNTTTLSPNGGSDIFFTKHSLPHVTVSTSSVSWPGITTYPEAIRCANTRQGRDTIRFCLPTYFPGPYTIYASSNHPNITDDTTIINAMTQPGFYPGLIRLRPLNSTAWQGRGIQFQNADYGEVHGLQVQNFQSHGIYFFTSNYGIVHDCIIGNNVQDGIRFFNSRKSWVYGCHIGVESNNQTAMPNGRDGIATNGSADSLQIGVGGVSTNIYRNYIYNNVRHGINLNTNANAIYGTTVGNDNQGNGGNGIMITGSDNRVWGGSFSSSLTYLIDNAGYGIEVSGSANTGNYLVGARFRCNELGGIEINTANNGVPAPMITVPDVTSVSGTGVPQASVRIFEHQVCGNAPCQGWTYLGGTTVDASGNWSIPGSFTSGSVVTAIHYFANSQITTYNTSEFSPCALVDFLLDGANIELSGFTRDGQHQLFWQAEGLAVDAVFILEKRHQETWRKIAQPKQAFIQIDKPNCDDQSCTYRVSAIGSNGQTVYSNQVELRTGIARLNLFPNPASEYLYIDQGASFSWKILDLHGKVVKTGRRSEERGILVKDLPPGIYFLQVDLHGNPALLRFVKR